ncbi:PQQ-binding-like beta-propeller repeat protein [Prauserella sp. PE36]|uniref:outer membrane protein assembly factor BamB family protein n=1 Tax=Prauserella sp. PE36 TaxID=1504709 RepID=UPI001313F72F
MALVLIVGAVVLVVALTREDSSAGESAAGAPAAPQAPQLASAWRIDSDAVDYPKFHRYDEVTKQVMVHDGQVIRLGAVSAQGMNPRTGEILWETPLPENAHLCGASLGTDGTLLAITYSPEREKECISVAVIDVTTGEVRDQDFVRAELGDLLVETQGESLYRAHPLQALTEDMRSKRGVDVFKQDRTGAPLWQVKIPNCFEAEDMRASAEVVLVLARCSPDEAAGEELVYGGVYRVSALDAHTGERLWVTRVATGEDDYLPALLAADPPVLVHQQFDSDCCWQQWYEVLDRETGEQVFTHEPGRGEYRAAGLSRHWFSQFSATAFAIVDDTMIVGTWPDGSEDVAQQSRQLIGLDLATGTERWRTELPRGRAAPQLAQDGEGTLYVYNALNPELYRLDPRTGQTRLLARLDNPWQGQTETHAPEYHPQVLDGMLVLFPSSRWLDIDAIAFELPG